MMKTNRPLFGMVVLAVAGLLAMCVMAADNPMRGKIEMAGHSMITISDDAGTQQTIRVAATAKITLNGKEVRLEELPQGATAMIETEKKSDDRVAILITAESPQ